MFDGLRENDHNPALTISSTSCSPRRGRWSLRPLLRLLYLSQPTPHVPMSRSGWVHPRRGTRGDVQSRGRARPPQGCRSCPVAADLAHPSPMNSVGGDGLLAPHGRRLEVNQPRVSVWRSCRPAWCRTSSTTTCAAARATLSARIPSTSQPGPPSAA